MTPSTPPTTPRGERALATPPDHLQLPVRAALAAALVSLASLAPARVTAQSVESWPIHSMERPLPPRVTPGASQLPALPPSDAVILFVSPKYDPAKLLAALKEACTPKVMIGCSSVMVSQTTITS